MIVVIDYNLGNIGSITSSLDRLGQDYLVTSDPGKIAQAQKVIFPGVGQASVAMNELKKRGLVDVIKDIKVPFLGICLGMQLLLDYSEEDDVNCLGIVPGNVKKFPADKEFKVPQIGWNGVRQFKDSYLFKDVFDGGYFYFVNSYYVETDNQYTLSKTNHGIEFVSAIKKDNFYGVQFHPEKSGSIGEKLLDNFCKL